MKTTAVAINNENNLLLFVDIFFIIFILFLYFYKTAA